MTKEAEIKFLQSSDCPSLNSHTIINFSTGWDGKNVMLRIDSVSSSAIFNSYFVNVNDLIDVFNDAQEPFSSSILQPVFKGKSVNSACFMMGIAKHLNLISIAPENGRKFVKGDPKEFLDSVQKLIKPTPKKKPATKKS